MTKLIAWYGDDFTGSAAVLEVLAFAGIDAVLFADIPDAALLDRFASAQAIGIASTARAHSPDWMRRHLPAPLAFLHDWGAPLLHYKICSTFDSAPHVGNIGVALDTALTIRDARAVPIVTAAPQMRRYQAFGNLFAGTLDGVYRLDQHPVMAHHPVTPMQTADLMEHLGHQTDMARGVMTIEDLWRDAQAALDTLIVTDTRLISMDNINSDTELTVGKLLWDNRDTCGLVAGSQGVEYALIRHWQNTGLIPAAPVAPSAGAVDQIVAVSGSVSPITAEQLRWSAQHGFALIAFDAAAAMGAPDAMAREIDRAVTAACAAAETGASPIIHSAMGPDDPAVTALRDVVSASAMTIAHTNHQIGIALGQILDHVLCRTGIRRAVISGGDTSGHGMQVLGLSALRALAPTIPGAALCTAYGNSVHDGLHIALKGGQMGSRDYFDWIRAGGGPR